MLIDHKQEGSNYYLSFIIWPFGVLLAAFSRWERPWAKNILWLFCIFFGLTYILAKSGTDDGSRHAEVFLDYVYSDLSFRELWRSLYAETSNYVDIVQPLLMYFVSRITPNTSILFGFFGLIFGYFYSRNIWYILEQIKGNVSAIIVIYILTFALLWPVWYIGNFRLVLAVQMFLFGSMPYLLEGNPKRIIWSILTIFVHFSSIFPVGILIIYILFKDKLNIYFIFFVVTAFVNEIDLIWLQSKLLSFLPDFFETKITDYVNPELAEIIHDRTQLLNWYVRFDDIVIKWITYGLVIYVYLFERKTLKNMPNLLALFCFSLLFFGLSNLISQIPSGYRFIGISYMFMFTFFAIFISANPDNIGLKFLTRLTIPALLLFCIVKLREGMDYFGFMTIFGNPITALFNENSSPIIIKIKQLIY